MPEITFARLFPAAESAESAVDASAFVNGLGLERALPPGRPLVIANFVATLEGYASFEGRSAPLSDPGDRALFHALRARADAILAGVGTLRAERYRPAAVPIVTITRSGALPTGIPLFQSPDGRVIAFSGSAPDLDGVAAEVSIEPVTEPLAVLETLRERYGVRVLLCEGGPGLFGAFLRAGLIDELFLTLGPKLAGGSSGPSITSGDPAPQLIAMQLTSVLQREGTLFLRYHHQAG